MIEIKKKRDFIRDFIARFDTQTREERWLLEYLVNSEYKLRSVIFVDELNPKFDGFKIYAAGSEKGEFEYISKGKTSKDVSLLFQAIHNSLNKVIYVQFEFEGKYNNELYQSIVETPEGYSVSDLTNLSEEELEEVNSLTENLSIYSYAGTLRDKIDRALEDGDKETFIELTNELKKHLELHNIE